MCICYSRCQWLAVEPRLGPPGWLRRSCLVPKVPQPLVHHKRRYRNRIRTPCTFTFTLIGMKSWGCKFCTASQSATPTEIGSDWKSCRYKTFVACSSKTSGKMCLSNFDIAIHNRGLSRTPYGAAVEDSLGSFESRRPS